MRLSLLHHHVCVFAAKKHKLWPILSLLVAAVLCHAPDIEAQQMMGDAEADEVISAMFPLTSLPPVPRGGAIPGECSPPELEDPGESDQPEGEPVGEPTEVEYPLESLCADLDADIEEPIEARKGGGTPVWVGTAQTRIQTVRMPTYTTVSLETRYIPRGAFIHQGGILLYSLTNTRTGLVHFGSMRLKIGQQIDYRLISPAQLQMQTGDTLVFTPLSTFAFFKLTPLGDLKLAWTPPNFFIPTTHVVQ